MRKFLMAAPLMGLLALTGCQSIPPNTVQQIQQTAVAVCGFLPTAATVANILAAGNPLVSTVSSVAEAICQAVVALPRSAKARKKRGLAPPTVNGVRVEGRFVR